jgi:hypothetical protein
MSKVAPFASNSAFFGLSHLSVWWLRLGIRIECIKPGRPQQNGRQEPMHLTSSRPYTGLGELEYPFHDRAVVVTHYRLSICLP